MPKKIKKIVKPSKRNNNMSYQNFRELLSDLTDEELDQVSDWLLDPQQRP